MSDSQNRVAVSEPSLDNKIKNWSDWQCLSPIIKARVTRQLRQQLNDRVFSELSNRFFDNDNDILDYLDLSLDEFFGLFEKYKEQHYDFNTALNKISPYTGSPIATEEEYQEYLREHFFYRLCVKKSYEQSQIYKASSDSIISELEDENRYLLTDNQHKSQRINALYEEKHCSEKIFRRVAAFLLALCIACGFFFHHKGSKVGYIEGESAGYDSGYNVGHADGYESGHEAGSADGYDRGYDFRYSAGERDASRSSTYPSGSTNTGIGSTRDTAIADGYIGNLNSHKFHYSWCSYLPDQENQIVFSSRDAAVSAGYDPCGRCQP